MISPLVAKYGLGPTWHSLTSAAVAVRAVVRGPIWPIPDPPLKGVDLSYAG
jgi:hypothetical protein